MSCDQNPGYLLYRGDYTTQLHRDHFISHCKDPYESTSIMECEPRVLNFTLLTCNCFVEPSSIP